MVFISNESDSYHQTWSANEVEISFLCFLWMDFPSSFLSSVKKNIAKNKQTKNLYQITTPIFMFTISAIHWHQIQTTYYQQGCDWYHGSLPWVRKMYFSLLHSFLYCVMQPTLSRNFIANDWLFYYYYYLLQMTWMILTTRSKVGL